MTELDTTMEYLKAMGIPYMIIEHYHEMECFDNQSKFHRTANNEITAVVLKEYEKTDFVSISHVAFLFDKDGNFKKLYCERRAGPVDLTLKYLMENK